MYIVSLHIFRRWGGCLITPLNGYSARGFLLPNRFTSKIAHTKAFEISPWVRLDRHHLHRTHHHVVIYEAHKYRSNEDMNNVT
jgi:hypothetical protein